MAETKLIEIKKLDDDGAGLAKIATISAIDHDGDTYAKGAFLTHEGHPQQVKVLAGHNWDHVPIGKGRVFEKGNDALAEFQLNIDTQAGKEWHSYLKFDMDPKNGTPLAEWSYGFKVLDSIQETRDGERVRVLKKLNVFEVSPVVKGAGEGTGTVAIKGGQKSFEDQISDMIEQAKAIAARAGEIADLRDERGRKFSRERLAQIVEAHGEMQKVIDRIEAGHSPPDQEVAARLVAQFEAIKCGYGKGSGNG